MLQPYRPQNEVGRGTRTNNNHRSSSQNNRGQPSSLGMFSRNNNELDIFGALRNEHMRMFQEFDDMSHGMLRNMRENFGFPSISSLMDDFGGGMFGRHNFDLASDFGSHMDFGNMRSGSGPMQVITKSLVQTNKKDGSGRMVQEKYYQDSMQKRGPNGQLVGEKRQAYQNTGNGVQKIAHERVLNQQGKKIVRERVLGGEENAHNFYYNMDEAEDANFNREWRNAAAGSGLNNDRRVLDRNDGVGNGGFSPSGRRQAGARWNNDLMPTQPAGRLQALPPVPTTTHAGRQIGTNAPPNYARPPVQPRQTEGVFRNAGAFNAMPKQG